MIQLLTHQKKTETLASKMCYVFREEKTFETYKYFQKNAIMYSLFLLFLMMLANLLAKYVPVERYSLKLTFVRLNKDKNLS